LFSTPATSSNCESYLPQLPGTAPAGHRSQETVSTTVAFAAHRSQTQSRPGCIINTANAYKALKEAVLLVFSRFALA
jgi:hypothetical protein